MELTALDQELQDILATPIEVSPTEYILRRGLGGLTYGVSDILTGMPEAPDVGALWGGRLASLIGFLAGPGRVLGLAGAGMAPGAKLTAKMLQRGIKLPIAAAPLEAARAIAREEPVLPALGRELPIWAAFGAAMPLIGAGLQKVFSPIAHAVAQKAGLPIQTTTPTPYPQVGKVKGFIQTPILGTPPTQAQVILGPSGGPAVHHIPGFLKSAEQMVAGRHLQPQPPTLVVPGALQPPVTPPAVSPIKGFLKTAEQRVAERGIDTTTVQRIVSKYPQKITDQKSLEEVGNKIAKEMGIPHKIVWKLQKGHSGYGHHRPPKPPLVISEGVTREAQPATIWVNLSLGRTQGAIKTTLIHELVHSLPEMQAKRIKGVMHPSGFYNKVAEERAMRLFDVQERNMQAIQEQVRPSPSPIDMLSAETHPEEKKKLAASLADFIRQRAHNINLVQKSKEAGNLPQHIRDIVPHNIYHTQVIPEKGPGVMSMMRGSEVIGRLGDGKTRFVDIYPIGSERGSIVFGKGILKKLTPTTHQDELVIEKPMRVRFFKPLRLPFWDKHTFGPFRPVWDSVNMKGRNIHRIIGQDAAEFSDIVPLIHKLSPSSKAKVADVLFKEDTLSTLLSPEDLKKSGITLTGDEVKLWKNIRSLVEKTKVYRRDATRWAHGYEKMSDAEKTAFSASVDKHLSSITGRVPHPRYGKYVVVATDKEGKLLAHTLADKKELLDVRNAFRGMQGVTDTRIYLHSELPHRFYPQMSYDSLMSLMDKANVDPTSTTAQAMREAVAKSQHKWEFVHRRNIPGYKMDFDTLMKSVGEEHYGAVHQMATSMAKSQARDAANAIGDVHLRTYAQEFVQNALSPMRSQQNIIRKTLYAWHLGLKPSYIAQNTSQTWLTTYPEVSRHLGVAKGLPVWGQAWGDSVKYVTAHLTGKPGKGINPEWMKLFKQASSEGLIRGQLAEMMWEQRLISPKFLSPASMKTQFSKAVTSFQWATEFSNRSHAFFAGLRTGSMKGLKDKALYDFAVDFIQRTQYVFGPENLPSITVNAGNLNEVVRMAYMYRSFMLNTLWRLGDVFFGKNTNLSYKAAQLISLTTLTGVLGFPAMGLTKRVLSRRGIDLESKVRDYVDSITLKQALTDWVDVGMEGMGTHPSQMEMGRRDIAQGITTVLLKGVPALAGVESPGWVGIGDFPFDNVDDVFGILSSVPKSIQMTVDAIGKRRGWKAAEYMMPALFSNLIKGRRWINEGVRTPDGEFLFEPTTFETLVRTIGIPGVRERRKGELGYVERRMIGIEKDKVGRYAEWMAKAVFEKDYAKYNRLLVEAREKGVRVSRDLIVNRLKQMQFGKDLSAVPKRMREKVAELRGKL